MPLGTLARLVRQIGTVLLAAHRPEKFKPLTMTVTADHRQLAPKTAYNSDGGCGHHAIATLTFSKLGWLEFFAGLSSTALVERPINTPEKTRETHNLPR